MLFVLDNYDSFTYNLVQYFGELGAQPLVRRNDEVTLEEVAALRPEQSYRTHIMTKVWTNEDSLKVVAILFIATCFFGAIRALYAAQDRLNERQARKAAKSSVP